MAVTSVGLAADATFIVSGSPVVAVGTLSLDWADVPAGWVLAGPLTGPDAKPTFKPLPAGWFYARLTSGGQFVSSLIRPSVPATWAAGLCRKRPRGPQRTGPPSAW